MAKKIVDRKLKEAVWKEGFSLEQQVFKMLKKSGWILLPNRYYFDSFLNRTREFDMLAFKVLRCKQISIFVVLVVECKFNPYKIVFYSRKSDGENYDVQAYIGDFVSTFLSHNQLSSVFKKLKNYKSFFTLDEQVFGFQTFEEIKDAKKKGELGGQSDFKARPEWSDKNIFSGINTVIQATQFEQKIRARESNFTNVIAYFPLVIFSDGLYVADLEVENRSVIRKDVVKYRFGMTTGKDEAPEEFTVHVCDLRGAEKFVKAVEHVSHKMFSVVDTAQRKMKQ